MNKKPAHLSGTAGQFVNPIEGTAGLPCDTEEMFLAKRTVQTLGDYIQLAQAAEQQKKKMTFEEWAKFMVDKYGFCNWQCEEAWKAGQENK